ncbi:MAG: hypothetical protein ACE5I5_02625 [Candidatus Heimdallarchaeota archaeon]
MQQEPAAVTSPERSKQRQVQLNGFLRARANSNTDRHRLDIFYSYLRSPVPANESNKEGGN